MNVDISALLDSWAFDPDSNVRQITDPDGREKIQVRVEQGPFRGILQMELEGRPDGARPHGRDFALDYFSSQRDRYRREQGSDDGWTLDRAACKELFEESRRVYERYAFLLQIADFPRVVRDTERNMKLFRFVHKYAGEADDRENLERWWPYVVRINGMAKAMLALRQEQPEVALRIVRRTRRAIDRLRQVPAAEFRIELDRSREALEQLERDLAAHRQPTLRERLETELSQAVDREEFERAAELRDRLKALPAKLAASRTATLDPATGKIVS
jgi:hypothetical protein